LEANTASFTGDLGKASGSLKVLANDAEGAGETVDFSMRDARGSMMLLGEEAGIHVPRELRTLIAEIPGVGEAFAALVPLIGAVFALGMIYKFVDAHKRAIQDLSEDEKTLYDNATKGAEKFLRAQEGSIKAAYALAIAQASGDPVRQAQLRVDEMRAIGVAQDQNMTQLIAEREVLRGIVTQEEKKAQVIKDSAGHNARTGQKYTVDTSDEDEKAQKARDKINELNDLIMAARDHEKESQAQLIDGEYHVSEVIASLASKDAAKQAEAFRKSSEIMHRAMEERKKAAEESVRWDRETTDIAEELDRNLWRDREKRAKEFQTVQQKLAEEDLRHSTTMARLQESADEQADKHALAMHQATARQTMEAEIKASQDRLTVELAALDRDIEIQKQKGEQGVAALRADENKKTELIKQAANEQARIQKDAEKKRADDVHAAELEMANDIAKTSVQSIMHGKNMAQAFERMGSEMLESAAEYALKIILLNKEGQLSDASSAATAAFKAVWKAVPFPASAVMAPAAAIGAFTGAISFESGGEIPGFGAVPIVGHGGETVITKQLTDQVKNSAGGGNVHHFHFAPQIQALDSEGMDRVLDKNMDKFTRRIGSELRNRNRR
jgi:hypothetical protein